MRTAGACLAWVLVCAAPAAAANGVTNASEARSEAPRALGSREPNEVTGWSPFAEADVVRIVTQDEDGAERDTPVWFVLVDGAGFVRTNDSRWLANIRRGSPITLRVGETSRPVTAEEVGDTAVTEAVEEAFKAKYGLVQRVMSAFRMREPTVLRLREIAA
jgi:hypothetical protein